MRFRPIALALLLVPAAASAQAPSGLRAGAAKSEFTPPRSALEHGAEIRDPLFARVIVVGDAATCAVLVGLDAGNLGALDFDQTVARAVQATGCPAANFIISSTHTHSWNTRGLNAPGGRPSPRDIGDAVVTAATEAAKAMRPARIGFGTTQVALNTNRDLFDGKWYQGTNRAGPSDKTLAVVEFLDEKGMPIGIYVNYAMHPINFYLSGQISADFPGEASRYLERRFPGAVALFTQGASGDQNPLYIRPMLHLSGVRTRMPDAANRSIDAEDQWKLSADQVNANDYQTKEMQKPVTDAERAQYDAAVAEAGAWVSAMGAMIGEAAIDVMRNLTPPTATAGRIWAGSRQVMCPGRDRLDPSARQGVLPPYKDGEPVVLKVGLLRLGDVHFASVNGEVYSEIGMRLKREAPVNKMMLVTLANGRANSGYIYSNAATPHLTFQVIGSRLRPGCAEDGIVNAGLALLREAGQ